MEAVAASAPSMDRLRPALPESPDRFLPWFSLIVLLGFLHLWTRCCPQYSLHFFSLGSRNLRCLPANVRFFAGFVLIPWAAAAQGSGACLRWSENFPRCPPARFVLRWSQERLAVSTATVSLHPVDAGDGPCLTTHGPGPSAPFASPAMDVTVHLCVEKVDGVIRPSDCHGMVVYQDKPKHDQTSTLFEIISFVFNVACFQNCGHRIADFLQDATRSGCR